MILRMDHTGERNILDIYAGMSNDEKAYVSQILENGTTYEKSLGSFNMTIVAIPDALRIKLLKLFY
ncbi:hypothetical protein Bca4012_026358 [Brassica carinata]